MIAAARTAPIAAMGALPFVVMIAPVSPDVRTRLYRQGAWLMFDPGFLSIRGATAPNKRSR